MQHRLIIHIIILFMQLVICGSFYPQYFSWLPLEEEGCEKAMSGHDPKTTVMLCVCVWGGLIMVCV